MFYASERSLEDCLGGLREARHAVVRRARFQIPNKQIHRSCSRFGSNKLRSDGNNNTITLPAEDTNLEVGLRVERPVSFTPGTYNYFVNLSVTIAPQ